MIRPAQFLVVLLLCLVVGASVSVQASYRDAERWFNSLAFEERGVIQLGLIWAGAYNGLVDGELGRRTYRSIQTYQRSIGANPTGALSRAQFDQLIAGSDRLMVELGFDFVLDQETGMSLALPTALLSKSGPTRRGFRWSSSDNTSVELETISMPVAEQSYLQLYERLSRDREDRRVTYRTFKPSFFVVSGFAGGKKFYSRFQSGPMASRGFSLAWDPALGPMVDRMAMVMSSLLLDESSGSEQSTAEYPAPEDDSELEPEHGTSDDIFQGTGFFVSAAGHVVTNDHVVERCTKAVIRLADGQVGEARIFVRSSKDDLAILKTDIAPVAVAEFRAGRSARVGEEVVVFGFPLIGDLGTSGGVLTTGHVSALAGPGDHSGILQMSAPVQSGNSGGPLLDQGGNVIGVVTWKSGLRSVGGGFEVLQNMNFAVKSSVVTNILDAHGVPYRSRRFETEEATTDIADAARQYTVLVICR